MTNTLRNVLRFTIRDVLLLAVIVGLCLAWWLDHRKLSSAYDKLWAEQADLALRIIAAESFPKRDKRITGIYEAAQKSPPAPEAAAEVISVALNDPEWQVRVRAVMALPYLEQRQQAIDVLLHVLRDRDKERSADGCLPLYAVHSLVQMKAVSAKGDIEEWLDFLKRERPYSADVMPVLISGTEKQLARLAASTEEARADAPSSGP